MPPTTTELRNENTIKCHFGLPISPLILLKSLDIATAMPVFFASLGTKYAIPKFDTLFNSHPKS